MEKSEIQEQIKIEPFTLLYDILSNWWLILLGAVSVVLLTYVMVNIRYVPKYTTKATFVTAYKDNANAYASLGTANEMAQTFEKILKSNVMKKTISEKMKMDIRDAKIDAQVLEGTNLLVLTVTAGSPKQSIDLIRTIMDNYTEVSFYTVGDNILEVLEEPRVPISPDNPLYVGPIVKKAAFFGAAFLIMLFGLLSYMKDTVKQEEDIEQKLDARNMGVIPYERKHQSIKEILNRKKEALLVDNPLAGFSFVESYKKLATKVDYKMGKNGGKVLVVTSVSENEGKSTVTANLAITLAQQGKRVLLIEGDLRRPSQFLIFNKAPRETQELGEFLKGSGKVSEILMKSQVPHLYLMVGRNCYSSSTELVHSERMSKLIEACKRTMDYIIIDSPPAGMMGDAEALAECADAVMLVVKQNFILSEDINDVLDAFREHHSEVLGVVLNGVRTFSSVSLPENYYGRYGHYGRYGRYGKYAKNRSE